MSSSLNQPILSDIFLSEDVKRILYNKYVIFIGDSVNRSMYKDLVKLYQKNEHLTDVQLKHKGEFSFENDRLLQGGQFGTMSNETTYTEVREFQKTHVIIRFYFITRCYSNYLKSICQKIKRGQKKPDVVIMNSCYWDLNRYGVNSVEEYKLNVPRSVQSLLDVLPKESVFIWTGALPVSKEIRGGFMGGPNIDQKVRMRMRENIVEANRFAAQVMNDFGVDFLDLHYHFRMQQFRRAYDGIHWDSTAHRRISNLLLHHLCECWDLKTPGRFVVSVREPGNVSEVVKQDKIRIDVELNKVVEEKKDDDEKEVEEDNEIGVIKEVEGSKENVNETPVKQDDIESLIESVELNKVVEEKKDDNEKEVEEDDDEIGVIKVVDDNKGNRDEEKLNEIPVKQDAKQDGIENVELDKIVEEKKDDNEKKVEEEDDEIVVINVVEGNKGKRDEEKLNETPKKITEEKLNSDVDEENFVLISSDSSFSSSFSPNSSNSSIKNPDSNDKTKETHKTNVNENKKQRLDTNKQFNDNQEQISNNNNNDNDDNTNSYLFESTSYYSFFMKNQSPNFNDDYVFNHNRTGYNFTDNMLNYYFSDNQNPFDQNYNSNGYNYENDRNSNNYSSTTNNSKFRSDYR